MDTVKKFIKYAIWLIIGYILVNVMTYAFIAKMYNNISDYNILVESPNITIIESKRTRINGYVIGRVTNNTDAMITEKYIRINFFNNAGQYVGTNYVELNSFQTGRTIEFRSDYNYLKVNSFTIDLTDKKVETAVNGPWFIYPDNNFARVMSWVGILLIIWYVF